MARIITATQAKVRLGSVIESVAEQIEEIVIENRGQPKVALISFDTYQKLEQWRETERRHHALAQLEALAAQLAGRNQDLDHVKADEVADRFTREVIEEMITEGKIRYGQAQK